MQNTPNIENTETKC